MKKKEKRLQEVREPEAEIMAAPSAPTTGPSSSSSSSSAAEEEVKVEYVSAQYADDESGVLAQFEHVFKRFASAEVLTGEVAAEEIGDETAELPVTSPEERAAAEQKPEEEVKHLSRRKRKQLSRMSVAELKQVVSRPEAVESHDVTAADPKLLVFLKSYRNAVPVPRHWCHKRRYLQGKRGVEKKPWALPEFIAQTGIEKIRKAIEEAEALKKVKQKTRERVQPKMGRMDVDYQVLHDAFFKWQTKPYLSDHGDLYYEGREFEVHLKTKRPGTLSAALKAALGMPDGAPPPWLINMQRYGPPPSYPNLRIPGLNAPIPEGASFGYHPGGWGKPPVDEYGIPLYGDVFGARAALVGHDSYVPDRSHWGELVVRDDEYEEEEEDEDEPLAVAPHNTKARYRRRDDSTAELSSSELASGIETPVESSSGVISGIETPNAIDLRKRTGTETPESSMGSVEPPKQLYKVIDEEKTRGAHASSALFASDKRYRLPQDDDHHQFPNGPAAGGGNDRAATTAAPTARRRDDDDDDDDPNNLRKRKVVDKEEDSRVGGSSSKKHKEFKF
ncbi:hypothetical protein CTAYLR_003246 [Chrysophaeum taylorii]|uniref:PSP proline-rich domain-containing protein n=1 Tax=Chrysophaeum taylorii TaxID=2483200 RepID=A0AAD7UA99_9STRA|nr:hypothetical protein CTAYLR_003246 [Chrysophaeum taylorii]